MALIVINTTLTATNTVVDLGTADSLSVGRDGYAASTDLHSAVTGSGSHHWVRVEGSLVGGIGLQLGDNGSVDTGETVLVTATGVVSGQSFGILLEAHNSRITNYGLIDGYYGVYVSATGFGVTTLHNAGDILGNISGVIFQSGEAGYVLNTGTIMGQNSALFAGGNDTLRNQGHLFGDVSFGGGNDLYDGRGGIVDGWINCLTGADTVRAGSGQELIDGGTDIDTLDFLSAGAIKVALDGSFANTKTATDDSYFNFENIIGSRHGDDVLTGDLVANVLEGRGGKDVLSGQAGADTLKGGAGADKLAGGLGDDSFMFSAASEGGDTISDFHNGAGDDDVIVISALGFGGALVAGALSGARFQTRSDNLAQDADDRFIFNTGDRTLWFDVNGDAVGGLTLLAKVQAGAVVTAMDVLLV